jgi:hypothetical protein
VGWWSVEFSLGECGKGVVRLLTSPCVGHIPFASLRFFFGGEEGSEGERMSHIRSGAWFDINLNADRESADLQETQMKWIEM